jgi:hypothetical protein
MINRVLVTSARSPAAVEIARLLHLAGIEVHVADSVSPMLAAGSKAVTASHNVPPVRRDMMTYGSAIAGLVERHAIDLIIPTCEEIFYLAALRGCGHTFQLFGPDFATLERLHNKFTFILLAQELGIEVPATQLLETQHDIDGIAVKDGSVIFKPVYSRFGLHVCSANQKAGIHPTPGRPWIVQERLTGEELCSYGIARDGRLLALAVYRPRYRIGQAASYYFEPVQNEAVRGLASKVIKATNYTGQISFDVFALPDGRVLPIECNPRATSGVHLFAGRQDIARLFVENPQVEGLLQPGPDATCMIGAAMAILGGPAALLGNPKGWWRDFKSARDVLSFGEDNLNGRALKVLLGTVVSAIARRQSLRSISTNDIEWDGEPLHAS